VYVIFGGLYILSKRSKFAKTNIKNKIDETIFSNSKFSLYRYNENSTHLILDGQTLQNLEILRNNTDHTKKNSLISLLDQTGFNYSLITVTPFGKRLFLKWVCFPLKSISKIEQRLKAVSQLSSLFNVIEDALAKMKNLCDLERNLMKIHQLSEKKKYVLKSLTKYRILCFTARMKTKKTLNYSSTQSTGFLY
jgi:DNA mismatch repair protein MSH6